MKIHFSSKIVCSLYLKRCYLIAIFSEPLFNVTFTHNRKLVNSLLLVVKLNALLIAHWRTVIVAPLCTSRSENLTNGNHWQCLSVGCSWTQQQVASVNQDTKLSSCIRHSETWNKSILTESAISGDSDFNNNIINFEVSKFIISIQRTGN